MVLRYTSPVWFFNKTDHHKNTCFKTAHGIYKAIVHILTLFIFTAAFWGQWCHQPSVNEETEMQCGRLGNLSQVILSGRADARTQAFWLQILCSLVSGVNLLSLSSEPTPLNGAELPKLHFSSSLANWLLVGLCWLGLGRGGGGTAGKLAGGRKEKGAPFLVSSFH